MSHFLAGMLGFTGFWVKFFNLFNETFSVGGEILKGETTVSPSFLRNFRYEAYPIPG